MSVPYQLQFNLSGCFRVRFRPTLSYRQGLNSRICALEAPQKPSSSSSFECLNISSLSGCLTGGTSEIYMFILELKHDFYSKFFVVGVFVWKITSMKLRVLEV